MIQCTFWCNVQLHIFPWETTHMASKKRIIIEVEEEFQRRLKATAALQGMSMKEYCQRVIGKELDKDEIRVPSAPSNTPNAVHA